MSPVKEHKEEARDITVGFCVLVTSDSVIEGKREDRVTPLARELIAGEGHKVVKVGVVPNKVEVIREWVAEALNECDIVLVTGGSGVSRKDVSVEAVTPLCTKELPGFGELFRWLSYRDIGSAAMLSRAYACVAGKGAVFVTPGSPEAVKLALQELILPEAKHLVYQVKYK